MAFPQVKSVEELLELDIPSGLASDIDETLSWTIRNWVKEIQEKFGNPENISSKEFVKRYQFIQNAPYYQTPEVNAWVKDKAYSNLVQRELPLIKEANVYIHKVNEIKPINCYLTSRPDCIVDGTREWLEKNNFPDAPIFAMPSEFSFKEGNRWKAEILKKSYPKILGIVDDNQGLPDALGYDYPGQLFLFGHEVSPNGHKFVVPCKDWERVYLEMKRIYS